MNRENNDVAGDMRHLRRSLSNRHIQLIAIGGAIGTGLFMGPESPSTPRARASWLPIS